MKKFIPIKIKDAIKERLRDWLNKDFPEIFYCNICKQKHSGFKPLEIKQYIDKNISFSISNFETLNLWQYSCPKCGCSDRDRLYAQFWYKELEKVDKIKTFIDFAPTPALSNFLKSQKKLNYRSADLFMKNVDDNVDLQNMYMYKDNTFDYIQCSHILEHVIDDKKAVKELYRILKKEGKGVIMAPIYKDIEHTIEDSNITDSEERWKYFGQNDHLRMYSKNDFIALLKSANFTVMEIKGKELFPKWPFLFGIADQSVLYVVTK